MTDKQFQQRVSHWIEVLLKTELHEPLVPQVATVLAQDERYGFEARSPEQQSVMGRAAEALSLSGVQR
ncbi:hypothetical protein [Oscillatoria acuminata]|uniref:Uncharacterized protein n=1 Tax=Oscillatoria acuminata PCC 6304 TaxID=56110 RepID=K9TTH8_9CYAN|nr:hypothetical protein [Oscillatoria acuminata]AFY85486.1 hypothetical protein Oscil6304_6026 [Oscillatoria acuminata PCC 6304]